MKIHHKLNLAYYCAWKNTDNIRKKRFIEDLIIKTNIKLIDGYILGFTKDRQFGKSLFTMASLSVIKALETYDPTRGVYFSVWWAYGMHSELSSLMYKEIKINQNECELLYDKSDDLEKNDIFKIVDKSNLNEREKKIILFYYKDSLSISQIAPLFGFSKQMVSKIKIKAIDKLKIQFKNTVRI